VTDKVRTRVLDTEDVPEQKKSVWSSVFNLVMFVVGGLALAWMLRTTSWPALRAVIVGVGAWSGVILALDLISLVLDALAWHAFMRPEARMVPFWRVLGAWSSGRAINVLTPSGALGEATKVTMLLNHAPRSRVLSSIVLLNVSMLYFSVTVMMIGIPLTLLLTDVPSEIKVLVGVGVAVIIPAMVALGFVIHRGAMATMVATLRRFRVISRDRAKKWKEKLKDVDRHIRELHTDRTSGTRAGFVYVLVSKIVSYTATIALLAAVGVPLTPAMVIGVLSVGVLITWIAAIVPLGIGVADGGNYALYALLGATGAQGLFVTMLTRARSVAIAMLGLAMMAGLTVLDRLFKRRIQHKIVTMKADAAAKLD
jgi:uncharacterized protein (TIRG00374 family)